MILEQHKGTGLQLPIHDRLLAGDPTAPADLVDMYLEHVVRVLIRQFPGVDEHVVQDAATDALLNYAERPEKYDPTRRSLKGYLSMAARADLLNLMKSEAAHRSRLVPLESVEFGDHLRNKEVKPVSEGDWLRNEEPFETVMPVIAKVARNDTEKQVLLLSVQGERRTEVFAKLLGIANVSDLEKRKEVKRVKERLYKKLRRELKGSQADYGGE